MNCQKNSPPTFCSDPRKTRKTWIPGIPSYWQLPWAAFQTRRTDVPVWGVLRGKLINAVFLHEKLLKQLIYCQREPSNSGPRSNREHPQSAQFSVNYSSEASASTDSGLNSRTARWTPPSQLLWKARLWFTGIHGRKKKIAWLQE